ncbi:preprotein translocase subunit SecE [Spiroplasma taiwanense]|uniref:Preprotein translocase subunit SecE n=1 Tax=Spiroplasma taiwanense CT-1 TaxID=1276220 RepID=S5MFU5_9MOLU|nr:preprotein translocase subunit SecE [Spiroplasma taiwanense]AGR40730.1 hypothetical protein STAIW_v1c00330 [Spiroplasma taiwanense CT-1]
MKSNDKNEILKDDSLNNLSDKDKRAKQRKLKLETKIEKKASKVAIKLERKKEIKELFNKFEGHDGTQEGKVKAAKDKKIKKHKNKVDYKLTFKEAPVKFLKEINKIKWSSRQNLGTKFLWVIIFIFIFGAFFFLVDWGLQSLFVVIKII